MNLSGASVELRALHLDATMDEGWHPHIWTVTAWWAAEPWRDARAIRASLESVLHAIAPEDGEVQMRRLPPELWTGEAIAKACLVLANIAKVTVDRPGFHVEVWA